MTDAAKIAAGLSAQERDIALALLGNAWDGSGAPSPGINVMNGWGLMHINALKSQDGNIRRYKARPTSTGLEVRTILERQANKAKHNHDCACDDCRMEWEQREREEAEREYQDRWNAYGDQFYREHPHG